MNKDKVVSKIVTLYLPKDDILYQNPYQEKEFVVTNPDFGFMFDRSLNQQHDLFDVISFPNITAKIEEKLKPNILNQEFNASDIDSGGRNNEQLHRQVTVFLQLIEELIKQGITDYHSIVPSFSALQACIKTGWKPKNISKVSSLFIFEEIYFSFSL
jgi:hypothetical protein